jgi:hypothetical protein
MGDRRALTPLFSNPDIAQPVGHLPCGKLVTAVGREGPWFKIASPDRSELYISATSVSQRKDRFVALDIPVPLSGFFFINGVGMRVAAANRRLTRPDVQWPPTLLVSLP